MRSCILPQTWLAGKPQLAEAIAEYLQIAAAIYHRLQTHFRQMADLSPSWAHLHGLATFENLINAYSGPDGAATLAYAVDRFAVLGRHHARPLRLLWLRLGRERNRCDLLAIRREGDVFIVESIEIKASETRDLAESEPDVRNAKAQIETTLGAVAAALPDATAVRDPLSAPRCEMLKEVLVRGCQSRAASAEKRALWSGWLKALFRQEAGEEPVVRCEGTVVRVLLRNNAPPPETPLATTPFPIVCRTLGEARIQELIESVTPNVPPRSSTTPAVPPTSPIASAQRPASDAPIAPPRPPAPVAPREARQPPPPHAASAQPVPATESPWPPVVNAIGMIGQAEAVAQLISQVNFARAAGRRFPDKLLVEPAGVGKSSVARAIARQLLNEEELLFNGADLKAPTAIISRLRERKKLPARPRGTVHVERCLIFIDEVHAITGATPTTLLSALDDERTTTVDGVIYDFSDVIFILATTDPGKLSEAFNSRPDKTYLRPYTLDEMAGILWLHGQQNLDGFELPREVCIEVAARMRCNPRRAVRALTQSLIPHFHERTHADTAAFDLRRIAEAMTQPEVAGYFDAIGIDMNGLDSVAQNYLAHLGRNGATSEERCDRRSASATRATSSRSMNTSRCALGSCRCRAPDALSRQKDDVTCAVPSICGTGFRVSGRVQPVWDGAAKTPTDWLTGGRLVSAIHERRTDLRAPFRFSTAPSGGVDTNPRRRARR
jgi:Holliday junction resolvasome RuvABC ATP-dependent DNA helicase subunit